MRGGAKQPCGNPAKALANRVQSHGYDPSAKMSWRGGGGGIQNPGQSLYPGTPAPTRRTVALSKKYHLDRINFTDGFFLHLAGFSRMADNLFFSGASLHMPRRNSGHGPFVLAPPGRQSRQLCGEAFSAGRPAFAPWADPSTGVAPGDRSRVQVEKKSRSAFPDLCLPSRPPGSSSIFWPAASNTGYK